MVKKYDEGGDGWILVERVDGKRGYIPSDWVESTQKGIYVRNRTKARCEPQQQQNARAVTMCLDCFDATGDSEFGFDDKTKFIAPPAKRKVLLVYVRKMTQIRSRSFWHETWHDLCTLPAKARFVYVQFFHSACENLWIPDRCFCAQNTVNKRISHKNVFCPRMLFVSPLLTFWIAWLSLLHLTFPAGHRFQRLNEGQS